jgi:transcriptional regulator with XRE-family HTH domain
MTRNFIQKLLSDDEGRKLYFREDLIFEITEAICKTMEERQISRTELSRLTGVSKSNISQLLCGDQNMRLTTVADLLYALDSKLQVAAVPIDTDTILEMADSCGDERWSPAREFTVEEPEYDGFSKQEIRLIQAA